MDDFEKEAITVRSKIEQYFSHLIQALKKRQTRLISELDDIISSYKQQRVKIEELEKLNEQHRKRLSSSSVEEILNGFIDKTETELSSLKEKTPITVRFEWNQKYAREASKLGKLETESTGLKSDYTESETKYFGNKPCLNSSFTTKKPMYFRSCLDSFYSKGFLKHPVTKPITRNKYKFCYTPPQAKRSKTESRH